MSHKTVSGQQRVLVVDDHAISRRFIVAALRQNNCAVKAAESVAESVDKAHKWLPEVIFTDWSLADGCGEDVVNGVRKRWPFETPLPRFVLVTGQSPDAPELESAQAAFDSVLFKPCSAAALASIAAARTAFGVQEGGDGNSAEIHRLFQQELAHRLPQLDALISNGQKRAAATISHQLIASSALCGQKRLAAAFRSLDTACREQAGAETLAQRWAILTAMVRDYLAGI